jgi:hypothetical protein
MLLIARSIAVLRVITNENWAPARRQDVTTERLP